MLMRILSPVFTAYPHKLGPHGSTLTFPLFPSVAHTPSGVVGVSAGAAAAAVCAGATVATAAGAGASLVTAGAEVVDAAAVEAGAVSLAAGAESGFDAG